MQLTLSLAAALSFSITLGRTTSFSFLTTSSLDSFVISLYSIVAPAPFWKVRVSMPLVTSAEDGPAPDVRGGVRKKVFVKERLMARNTQVQNRSG